MEPEKWPLRPNEKPISGSDKVNHHEILRFLLASRLDATIVPSLATSHGTAARLSKAAEDAALRFAGRALARTTEAARAMAAVARPAGPTTESGVAAAAEAAVVGATVGGSRPGD